MPGAEVDLAYIPGLVTLVLLGPGLLSVDERIGLEPHTTLRAAEAASARP